MKRSAYFIAAILSALLLCSCAKGAEELPEDNPANHWGSPIMETDKGYFSNNDGGHMYLRYYEKNSDNEIFLCARPECMHNGGDGCTATYKGLQVINTLMYEGSIYIYTIGEEDGTVSFSLYRAAADGSAITKVGDAFTAENSAGEEYSHYSNDYFIIHKGKAYMPYHLNLGDSTYEFVGSGLVEMDIFTGKTKLICSGENYFSPYPAEILGNGEYVYFKWNDMVAHIYEERAYNINTGEIKEVMFFQAAGKDRFYTQAAYDDGTSGLYAFPKDLEVSDDPEHTYEEMELIIEKFDGKPHEIMYYDGKIIVIFDEKIEIYDETGAFIDRIETASLTAGASERTGDIYLYYAASGDRLFVKAMNTNFNDPVSDRIYSVPFDNLESGWELAYEIREAYIIDNERGSDYVYSVSYGSGGTIKAH